MGLHWRWGVAFDLEHQGALEMRMQVVDEDQMLVAGWRG